MSVVQLRPLAEAVCPECGDAAGLSCIKCGWSARERAMKAIAQNPHKSDRMLAREAGVSAMAVNRARSTVTDVTVERRLGADGKTRALPVQNRTTLTPDDQVRFLLALIKPHWRKLSKLRRRELIDKLEDMV